MSTRTHRPMPVKVRAKLRTAVHKSGINTMELERQTGVSEGTVRKVVYGKREARFQTDTVNKLKRWAAETDLGSTPVANRSYTALQLGLVVLFRRHELQVLGRKRPRWGMLGETEVYRELRPGQPSPARSIASASKRCPKGFRPPRESALLLKRVLDEMEGRTKLASVSSLPSEESAASEVPQTEKPMDGSEQKRGKIRIDMGGATLYVDTPAEAAAIMRELQSG